MKKTGVTIISLSVIVVVMLIILSVVSVSLTYSITNAKKMAFAQEIYNIQSLVTEHIAREETLPNIKESITIDLKDLNSKYVSQFDGETIVENKVNLNVLELLELDIKNTNYGNKSLGKTAEEKAKDIYAVSETTGRVYYIAGFESRGKKYYTLTDELRQMIEKNQNITIGEKSITFTPSKIGWSNEGVLVNVFVPSEYTSPSITIDNGNITYTESSTTDGITYIVNSSKVVESYTITINYTKNGKTDSTTYTTKIDTETPVISKDSSIANTTTQIKGFEAADVESGIKYFKYAEGIINENDAKEYMRAYGLKIKKGSISMKNKEIYTLYAEDKASNYQIYYIDGSGERFYPNIAEKIGTFELRLDDCYNANMVNYRVYGNSVQSLLPLEYQQVEYIRNNTRKESINIGISPNTNTQVEIDMQIEAYTSNAANLDFALGCRASNSNLYGRFEFHVNSNLSNTLNLGYDVTQAGRTVLTEAVQDFKRHTYVFDSNEGTSYMDDVLTCYYTNTSAYKENWEESSTPLYLFRASYDTSSIYTTYVKIYRCKITKDDILVRDLVPCYRKSDDVIGMYDLVNNKFYTNAGTGTFLKGNNVTSPYAPIEFESVGDYDETTGKYKIPVKVNDTITNIYLNEPLRKIGDYADYIDFQSQKVFRNVEVLDNTGTLTLEESLRGVVDNIGTAIKLPKILLNQNTNVIKVNTKISPSQTNIWYYIK